MPARRLSALLGRYWGASYGSGPVCTGVGIWRTKVGPCSSFRSRRIKNRSVSCHCVIKRTLDASQRCQRTYSDIYYLRVGGGVLGVFDRTRCTELILLFRSLSSRRLHGGLSTPAGAPQSTAGSAVRATAIADQEAHRVLEGASQVRRASARPASMILL